MALDLDRSIQSSSDRVKISLLGKFFEIRRAIAKEVFDE